MPNTISGLFIIGGGIDGCGIDGCGKARAAAGRGLSVTVAGRGDFGRGLLSRLDQTVARWPALT